MKLKTLNLNASHWSLRPIVVAASGFGLGLSPVASGTFGTLPGILIVLLAAQAGITGVPAQVCLAVVLTLAAIPLCHVAERHFGRKDDGRIVADEYLTFPISMIGLPLVPWVLAMAFVTNRCMDILKPPPANQMQNLHGGFGIVLDDAVSAFYSLLLNHLIFRFVLWIY